MLASSSTALLARRLLAVDDCCDLHGPLFSRSSFGLTKVAADSLALEPSLKRRCRCCFRLVVVAFRVLFSETQGKMIQKLVYRKKKVHINCVYIDVYSPKRDNVERTIDTLWHVYTKVAEMDYMHVAGLPG